MNHNLTIGLVDTTLVAERRSKVLRHSMSTSSSTT